MLLVALINKNIRLVHYKQPFTFSITKQIMKLRCLLQDFKNNQNYNS